jgi:hypothetical protein
MPSSIGITDNTVDQPLANMVNRLPVAKADI